MTAKRLFAGERLRAIRARTGLGQAAMAARLGISVSYLSQIENDARPLTPPVLAALARHHPLDLDAIQAGQPERRFTALHAALADPIFAETRVSPDNLARIVEQQPDFADRFLLLHDAYRRAEERLQMVDEGLASGGGRLPWEEVRDWFHEAGNYVDPIDRGAEALAAKLPDDDALLARLAAHGLAVAASDDPDILRQLDTARGRLTISTTLPAESRRFMLAHQLAALELQREIAAITDAAALRSDEARRLLSVGLANYAAGALLMPYERFRAAARAERHDIDRLSRAFGVSFEQACHRLSTLQRPGARGMPVFFCRVDMAGNITKRHSATRLQFARFGGACPLWVVHEAVAIPDRIMTQLVETPDGVRYISMAKGLVKASGSYNRASRRYAVALGCEAEHARDFVYADGIDLSAPRSATPIGLSCRLCPRPDCDQRAFPPADRAIAIDPAVRRIVPYRLA